jgi:hypothetical protein
MFYTIYYEDTDYKTFDVEDYENKIVRVIVRKKTNIENFEKFIDKLNSINVAQLKIVENFDLNQTESFEAFESEDTLNILNKYVEDFEINLDKTKIKKIYQEIYQEACELM